MGPTTVCRWLPDRAVVETYVDNLLGYSRLIHGCHPYSCKVLASVGQDLDLDLPTLSNVELDIHQLVHYCPSLRGTPVHDIRKLTVEPLDPMVQEFQDFIAADAEVLMYFNQMFCQAPALENCEKKSVIRVCTSWFMSLIVN